MSTVPTLTIGKSVFAIVAEPLDGVKLLSKVSKKGETSGLVCGFIVEPKKITDERILELSKLGDLKTLKAEISASEKSAQVFKGEKALLALQGAGKVSLPVRLRKAVWAAIAQIGHDLKD